MKNFKANKTGRLPAISTAALPDIVFILLFFFMTVATIKNQNVLVENDLPKANETEKLNKTDRVIEIFVGHINEKNELQNGAVKIQIGNRLVDIEEVGHQIIIALNNIPEHLRKMAIVSIKADKKVKMGLIADIKKELKEVNLLKINYTTVEGNIFANP